MRRAMRTGGRRGSSIIEFSLLMPWYVFLFVAAFDYGFFSYSLISANAAVREAALYCSATSWSACVDSSSSKQCTYALSQLQMLPNVGSGLTTCGTGTSVTSSAPVAVSSSVLSSTSPDGNPAASVTVVYLTPQLIPIPGLLPGQLTITRTVTMRYAS